MIDKYPSRRFLVAGGLVLALASSSCMHTELIVFQSRSTGKYEIYTIHPDGTMLTQVTHGPLDNEQPCLNPGATRVSYVARQTGTLNGELRRAYTTGGADTRIDTAGLVGISGGRWSPNGEDIAFSGFARNENDGPNIYLVKWDGTSLEVMVDDGASDIEPSFSPDGSKMLFTSTQDGNSNIYVMNIDGSDLKRLTINPAADAQATFNDDGTKIAFWSDRTGGGDVYLMNADGSDQVPVMTTPEVEFEPQFSPNGHEIVFTRGGDLHIVNLVTKVVRRLTTNMRARAADWK